MSDSRGAGSLAHGIDRGVSYRIDPDRRLIVVTYIGAVTLADIVAAQQMARADPAFDPAFAVLMDGLHADFSALTAQDLAKIASRTPSSQGGRRAILVNSQLNYGLARMFSSISEAQGQPFPVALFDKLEDALRWLNEPAQR